MHSTPSPRAVTGRPAGSHADPPRSSASPDPASSSTRPDSTSTIRGPAAPSGTGPPASSYRSSRKSGTGGRYAACPGPTATGDTTGGGPSATSTTRNSSGTSTCLAVNPPRSTLSELASTSTAVPLR